MHRHCWLLAAGTSACQASRIRARCQCHSQRWLRSAPHSWICTSRPTVTRGRAAGLAGRTMRRAAIHARTRGMEWRVLGALDRS
jgi:hypothetical protein